MNPVLLSFTASASNLFVNLGLLNINAVVENIAYFSDNFFMRESLASSPFPPLREELSRKTAPASLGIRLDPTFRFMSPAITPATNKQNQRLETLLKLLASSNNQNDIIISKDGGIHQDQSERRQLLASQFDKSWNELMGMIGM
jgi:hypothetical protein